jgi:hypothetical protein
VGCGQRRKPAATARLIFSAREGFIRSSIQGLYRWLIHP